MEASSMFNFEPDMESTIQILHERANSFFDPQPKRRTTWRMITFVSTVITPKILGCLLLPPASEKELSYPYQCLHFRHQATSNSIRLFCRIGPHFLHCRFVSFDKNLSFFPADVFCFPFPWISLHLNLRNISHHPQ